MAGRSGTATSPGRACVPGQIGADRHGLLGLDPQTEAYDDSVDLVISDEARAFVKAHGGTAFVTAHRHRCCTGALTLLDVTTEIPAADADFESVDAGGVRVRFSGGPSGRPHKLVIELRGRLRRHPVAYWDGCAFKP
jgi:hypothetical protein